MQQNSFDTYSKVYDEDFTFSPIGKMQRARVHWHLEEWLPKHFKVLEINCGTGEDARWIASKVKEIVATDISEKMIEVCRNKHISKATFEVCDCRKISERFAGSDFNLLFSDFGGLNCLSPEEIKQFSEEANKCLESEGILLAVVMGRKCSWERFYFRWKKDVRYNRRKKKEGVETVIGNERFLTWYYSPEEFALLLSDNFNFIEAHPIGLFIPPSYLNPFFKKKKWLLSILYDLEKLFGSDKSLSDHADHYLIAFKKKKRS